MDKKAYRYKKWALMFDMLDLDQDGWLSFEEYMFRPIKLIKSGQVERGTRLALVYNEGWNKKFEVAGIKGDQRQMDLKTYQIGLDYMIQLPSYKEKIVPDLISDAFDSIDANKNGEISFLEWRTFYSYQGITDESFIKSTFNKLDTNKDGNISKAEFQYAFEMLVFNDDETQDYSFLLKKKH